MSNMDELFATYVTVNFFNKYNTRLKPGVSILSKKDLFCPPTPELLSRKSLRSHWGLDERLMMKKPDKMCIHWTEFTVRSPPTAVSHMKQIFNRAQQSIWSNEEVKSNTFRRNESPFINIPDKCLLIWLSRAAQVIDFTLLCFSRTLTGYLILHQCFSLRDTMTHNIGKPHLTSQIFTTELLQICIAILQCKYVTLRLQVCTRSLQHPNFGLWK